MFKNILSLFLLVAILALSSCQVVEVIDHGTTLAPVETTQPKEYDPWGFWYSYQTSGVLELTQGSDKAKLYYLTTGYYEYYQIEEVNCSFDGNATFTLSYGEESVVFTFDKYADTLKMDSTTYLRQEKAPTKHPVYSYPDYASIDPASIGLSVQELDFATMAATLAEGVAYDIALELYGAINKLPKIENASRPTQSGDCVNIDYCGKLDGVAFEGGTATNVALFISDYKNGYIPGFTDGIIGHEVGETFDVPVTFPENYHATDLAGKAVVFTMTINAIYDQSVSDEQVAEYTGNDYTTYAEWVEAKKETVTKTVITNAILEATAIANLPEETYMYYYQQTIDYYHLVAYYYNIDYQVLLYYYGLSEAKTLQESINQATYDLALYVLAAANDLAWTEEELSAKYEAYVADYLEDQKDATEEEARQYADGLLLQMKHELTTETVVNWAINHVLSAGVE